MCIRDRVYTVGLVLDEKEIYQIPVGGLLTGDYLCGKLKTLADRTLLCAMDIKAVLKHVPLENPEKVFDAGVAAYLLNPLKSAYTHDDIAREYLDARDKPFLIAGSGDLYIVFRIGLVVSWLHAVFTRWCGKLDISGLSVSVCVDGF